LYTGVIWTVITLGLALVAPFVTLLLFGLDYAPAIPMLFPLLIQSVAVGFGVGLGIFRVLDKLGYSIAIQIVSLIIGGSIGYFLIKAWGGYGAAWFYSERFVLQTVLGIAVALWLLKRAEKGK